MSWSRFLFTLAFLALWAGLAPGGILFKKHTKPAPAQRVPELLLAVKTEPDEHKRAAAAAELRQYDPKVFPEIVPILADVLHNDAKAGVRLEAAVSLSRIRPVSQEAGMALEQASTNDPALRVRMQARTSLVYYRLSGYHSPKKKDPPPGKQPPMINTQEPPLAEPIVTPNNGRLAPVPKAPNTTEPPAAVSKPVRPIPDISVAQPLPNGPAKSPLVPAQPPKLETPPPPPAKEQGPSLNPPY
jgi:hypothetical protein